MADHDTPGRPDGRPPLRIGDAERQRMIDTLQKHVSAGRLDMPEYERRVEHATGAVFARDLDGLLDDLPPLTERSGDDAAERGRGGSQRSRGPRSGPPGWWPPSGRRRGGRPPWAGGRGIPVPLIALGAIALVVVTHGWILFPLLFLFVFSRGGGMCGPRHHGGDVGHRGHHDRDGRHGHAGPWGRDQRDGDHRRHAPWWDDGEDVWDEPTEDRPSWPGRYDPDRDDERTL